MLVKTFPLVSILILNYNGLEYVDRCLSSVLRTNYPKFEVIFVDNASTDGSYEYVKQKYGFDSRLQIIRNDRNYGFAGGNNIGIKHARGEYIAFLNMDVEADPNWLMNLIAVMESDETIGAAQSKLLLMNDRERLDTCGHLLTPFGFTIERGVREVDKGQYDYIAEILGAKGAALIIKRKVIQEVGLFDPIYFALREETDLCWRIWLRGYKVVFVPSSIVFHAVGAVSKSRRAKVSWWHETQLFYWYRNMIITLLKNLDLKNIIKIIPLHLLLALGDAITSGLKSRSINALMSLIKAVVWILVNFKLLWKKREYVQRFIRKKGDEEIMPHVMAKVTILGKLRERSQLGTRSAC